MPEDPNYVTSVLRALTLLDAFGVDDGHLSLAELCRRLKLPKTTTLRIAKTLEVAGYLVQTENSQWRLGPSTARLAGRYLGAFDAHHVIEPILVDLAQQSREDAAFFVLDGANRIRLLRAHGNIRRRVKLLIGEALPLDKGSPGKVILAFRGEQGPPFDEIRARGYCCTRGEARVISASVSAPVYGSGWSVLGAVCVSSPRDRMTLAALEAHAPAVVIAARKVTSALAQSLPSHITSTPTQWFR